MVRPRRWAAAAGVFLALLAAGPASAQSAARSFNATAQVIGSAQWTVVIVNGTSPATGPAPAPTFSTALGVPAYLTLTNTGTVVPGTMTVTASAGLALLTGVALCRVPWNGAVCASPITYTSPVFVAGTSQAPPAPGESWYLRVSGLVVTNASLYAVATKPNTTRTLNS